MHVVATAGHVDHGKSTLVQALTGIDPDRLTEEKARGLTIDLGFAWTALPSGHEVAFVDVPGHVRFLKNMLAGVGAVDACLFVVAATEGWKPQSEEHLRILDLLGVRHGIVALTKAGLVGAERLELVEADVRRRLEGTGLAGSPVVATDAPSATGILELIEMLDELLGVTPRARDLERPRLWVDRAFPMAGSGTVVTGTLTGGSIALGDELELVPGGSGRTTPRPVRVRSVQTQKRVRQMAEPGNRVALGLVGTRGERVSHRQLGRGQAVVRAAQWEPTSTLDATLQVLDSAPAAVGRRGAYLAYIGSGEFGVHLRVLGAAAIEPGHKGVVRLHLPVRLALLPGDRYILRESGRSVTVGGGQILDVRPVLPAAQARPDGSVDRVVAERGWIRTDELERLTGVRRPATLRGGWIVDGAQLAAARETVLHALDAAGERGLEVRSLDERHRALVAHLEDEGQVAVSHGRARRPGQAPSPQDHPYVRALEAAPFTPPDPATAGVDRSELRQLVLSGSVVERDGHYFSAGALERASIAVAELLADHPNGITVSVVRERLGSTRKHIVPLLNLLDAQGVTRRRGELRVAGPRLPQLRPDPPDERDQNNGEDEAWAKANRRGLP